MFLYFALAGAALGISGPSISVMWAELYGTKHIGSIKGFIGTFRNGLTALGPLPIAILIDKGVSIESIFGVTAAFICVISIIPICIAITHKKLKLIN